MTTALILLIAFELAWVAFTACQVGDVATTNQFLKEHKASEAGFISGLLQAWLGGPKGYQGPWWIGKLALVIVLQILGVMFWIRFGSTSPAWFGLLVFAVAGLDLYYWADVLAPNIEADRGPPA